MQQCTFSEAGSGSSSHVAVPRCPLNSIVARSGKNPTSEGSERPVQKGEYREKAAPRPAPAFADQALPHRKEEVSYYTCQKVADPHTNDRIGVGIWYSVHESSNRQDAIGRILFDDKVLKICRWQRIILLRLVKAQIYGRIALELSMELLMRWQGQDVVLCSK